MICNTKRGGVRLRTLLAAAVLAFAATLSACAPPGPYGDTSAAGTPDRTIIVAVEFDLNSHRIRPEYFQTLDAIAVAMLSQQLAGYRFDVDGHTDLSGRFAYNVALSNLRAQAVVDYLVSRGVSPYVLRPQGFGPLNLLNPANPYGAENRRVEVTSIR